MALNAIRQTLEPSLFPRNPSTNIDEIDNKTLYQEPRLIRGMNDKYHREDERLKTFDTWPIEWLDKSILARTGLFYTNEDDKVKCYFCEVEIGRWERDDLPVSEHMRWSPNCPLLRRRTTNNVPINYEELELCLPPMSYDICGANDSIEVRHGTVSEGHIPLSNIVISTGTSTTETAPATNHQATSTTANQALYYPEYPEYAIESARLRSYADWPRNLKQKPTQLAEAGFFYTGTGDRVRCFSCGGGLKDWDDNDEPWEQHALWLSNCRFLKLMKGSRYIDSIKEHNGQQEVSTVELQTEEPEINTFPRQTTSSTDETKTNDCTSRAASAAAAGIATKVSCESINDVKTTPAIPEEKLCKICYVGEYNTAFLPCGHVVACAKCASSVTKCPLCRKSFTDVMRVYFS